MTRTASDEEYDSFENRTSENLTLADHLLWQLNLMPLTERDMLIARVLVDSINSDGFLDADLMKSLKRSLKNSRIWNMTRSSAFYIKSKV